MVTFHTCLDKVSINWVKTIMFGAQIKHKVPGRAQFHQHWQLQENDLKTSISQGHYFNIDYFLYYYFASWDWPFCHEWPEGEKEGKEAVTRIPSPVHQAGSCAVSREAGESYASLLWLWTFQMRHKYWNIEMKDAESAKGAGRESRRGEEGKEKMGKETGDPLREKTSPSPLCQAVF